MPASHWLSQILASQTSHLQEQADAKSKRVHSIATCMMLCACSDIKVYFPALLVCGMLTCIQMVERQGPKHKSALDAFPLDREPTRHIRAKLPLYSVTLILIFKIGGVPDNECQYRGSSKCKPQFLLSNTCPELSLHGCGALREAPAPETKPWDISSNDKCIFAICQVLVSIGSALPSVSDESELWALDAELAILAALCS